ncbi:hypothetical protein GGX14DRAFT_387929 [Mycena pura]|uniref:Uncharacterized protein n=1 Tax=Mycena pura TaxID=153505 RepID=A0AAD6VTW2_9AGAR|nr:hypothetical protein GGX14DRAFT_387929 [Mycena pura]
MPPGDGPLWPYFHKSKDKPNGSHHRATHWRCIDAKRPQNEPIDVDTSADVTLNKNAEWFQEEALAVALEAKDDVNGEKKAMASHLRTCPHATAPEKAKAAEVAPTKAEQKAAQTKAELLAAEHSDEEPDAGALEGSGDDYSE